MKPNSASADKHLTSAQAIRKSVCETYLTLARGAPNAKITVDENYWSCSSTFAHPIANFAGHFNLRDGQVKEIAAKAKMNANFRAYVIDGDSPDDLSMRFEEHGLVLRYELQGMEAALDGVAVEEEVLARVETTDELESTARFMVDTFFWRSPASIKNPLSRLLTASGSAGHEFYFAEDNRGIFAAATLAISGGVAGLYNLCIRPDRRLSGAGSACVRQLMSVASVRQLRLVLQCDVSLVPWYRRLGFSHGAQLQAYSY